MAVETELKLRLAPEHLKLLKRHSLLRNMSAGRVVTRKLYSVYYDTPDLALHRRRMALRLRRDGRRWLQTLKGGGGVQAGLHRRNEWETPVAGEALDFEALAAAGCPKLSISLRKQLQPLFVTDFSRTSHMLNYEGAEIEICMDSGEIRSGRKRFPISEIELELKSGGPRQLFRLAQTLLEVVPLEIEHISKAEHGYRLYASDATTSVRRAHTPDIGNCNDAACSLHVMASACLAHLQANIPGALEGRDEEFLHQVRVALRRLRVVLAMAERFHADAELSALHEEVSGLCVELGRLREWDVFVAQTLKQVSSRSGLLREARKRRNAYLVAMRDRLHAPEYQRLLLGFGAWLHGDYWQAATLRDMSPEAFASRVLDKQARQTSKRGRHIAQAETSQLHALRIACKKLRYSAEMFETLFTSDKAARYRKALSVLQGLLGTLNDITTANRLLEEMEVSRSQADSAKLRDRLDRDYLRLRAKLDREWEKFAGRKTFWSKPDKKGKPR